MLQRDETPLSELQRKMVDEAERSCQRLIALIAELSEIQKLDANLVELARQELDAFPVMADAAQGVRDPQVTKQDQHPMHRRQRQQEN